jgi:hypothetical protein
MKIKTPPMPEPEGAFVVLRKFDVWEEPTDQFTLEQMQARDKQWLELIGPLVEALNLGIEWADEYATQMRSYTVSDIANRDAQKMRAALSNITEA